MPISKKILKISSIFLLLIAILFIYFNFPVFSRNDDVEFGVTFSSRYAGEILPDWKEAYTAMLDDLGVRKVRIPVYWDAVEPNEGEYYWDNIDWQLAEAKKRGAEIILVVGQKVPRWPECFVPEWADTNDEKRKASLLKFVMHAVERYKDNTEVKYWQVENEPFLPFGICPKADANLLDQELAVVRNTDPGRKVIVTDSGELSLWVRAAKRADIFGTTMYRTIWKKGIGYFDYPIGPRFFHFKAWLNRIFAGQTSNIVIELQAEPWISGYTTQMPLEEQFKSMNQGKLIDNVNFAKEVGFPEVYLWGVEWWYWLKTEKNHPELWDAAKLIFR